MTDLSVLLSHCIRWKRKGIIICPLTWHHAHGGTWSLELWRTCSRVSPRRKSYGTHCPTDRIGSTWRSQPGRRSSHLPDKWLRQKSTHIHTIVTPFLVSIFRGFCVYFSLLETYQAFFPRWQSTLIQSAFTSRTSVAFRNKSTYLQELRRLHFTIRVLIRHCSGVEKWSSF